MVSTSTWHGTARRPRAVRQVAAEGDVLLDLAAVLEGHVPRLADRGGLGDADGDEERDQERALEGLPCYVAYGQAFVHGQAHGNAPALPRLQTLLISQYGKFSLLLRYCIIDLSERLSPYRRARAPESVSTTLHLRASF